MSDNATLPELTRRQEDVLSYVITAYTESAEPVGSKHLVEKFDLSVSSATVRNEMARLEEMGYIIAPHTSAGRIPTTRGYRYFVKRLINSSDLTQSEQVHINERFARLSDGIEQWMRQAATILARTSESASLVTPPVSQVSRFKHIELIAIEGRLVLMVLVLQGGSVHQRMLTLADALTQDKLSDVAIRVNDLYSNLNANQVRMKNTSLTVLEDEITDLIIEVMETADNNQVRYIYRDGLSKIINRFSDGDGAQQALRVFEERAFLNMLITEIFDTAEAIENDVQVLIGGGGRWDEISGLSMVLSRYGVPGKLSGAVGVLGPTHINYGRAISSVRYVSNLMTEMLGSLYQENIVPDHENKQDNA